MAELVSIKKNVDVSPGQAAPAVFHCSQGDVGSKIILGLLNNGTAYAIPPGVTVTIEGSESNGSIFTPISATASGSDITFYLTGEMTAVAGPAICQAVLKSGSNILGTANFTLEVESSPMGVDAPPVSTDVGWTWMLNKLNTEFVPALGDNIIDAIDSKLDKNQGTANAGKYLKVGADGNVETADLDVTTDKTLSVADKAADAKAVGDELTDLKADINRLRFNTVADMIANRTLSVGDIAETLGYNTKDDGFGGLYTIVSTGYAQKDYEELQNGLYAVKNIGINSESQTKSTDINLFLESAMTYQAHASEFLYSADNDTTYPTCLDAGYVAGTKYIDCSTLFKLVVNRISYTDSKYGGGTNKGKGDSFKLPDDYTTTKFTGTRYAYQQAHYLANKGLCYYPNADRSNLRIGDICFFDFTGSHLATTFMGIDHVAIYMGYCGNASDGTPRYQFISNDNSPQYRELHSVFFVADSAYLSKIVLCASIPNALFSIRGDNIIVDGDTTVVRANEGLLAPYRVREKLKSNTFYTVVLDVNDASIPVAVRTIKGWMYMNAYDFLYYRSTSKHKIIHVITGDLSAGTDIENSIVQIQNNSSKRLEVYNFKITEGWYDDIQSSVLAPIPLSLVSGASGFFRLYPNREAISVDFSTARSGAFDIATYDTNLPIKNHYSVVAGGNSSGNWVPVIIHYANGTVNALTGDDSNINRLRLNDF